MVEASVASISTVPEPSTTTSTTAASACLVRSTFPTLGGADGGGAGGGRGDGGGSRRYTSRRKSLCTWTVLQTIRAWTVSKIESRERTGSSGSCGCYVQRCCHSRW